jgi:hypothetical protein
MADDELDALIRQLEGLLIQIAEVRHRREGAGHRSGSEVFPPIVVGDRVRIVNRVNRPNGWPPAPSDSVDQVATVTRVTSGRVYFTTDTGISTWRAPANVVRIGRDQDVHAIRSRRR